MNITRKLRGVSGSSMVLALGVMLAVSVLCVSMVSTAYTAPMASNDQRNREQAYLASTSAAHLINDMFADKINNSNSNPYPEAMLILQELDDMIRPSGDAYYDSSKSVKKTLQLSRDGMTPDDLNALNQSLDATVTFTKKNNAEVTAAISRSGLSSYPVKLSFPVYTEVMTCTYCNEDGDESGTITKWGTYPEQYEESLAVAVLQEEILSKLEDCPDAVDCHYKYTRYDTAPTGGGEGGGGETPDPVSLWRALWQYECKNEDSPTTYRRIASASFVGENPPTDEQIAAKKPSTVPDTPTDPGVALAANRIWTGDGSWSDGVEDSTELTITYTCTFTAANRCRIIWKNSDGTVLGSSDYAEGTEPTDPAGPTKDSENVSYYEYEFDKWISSDPALNDNEVPVTMKEPTYKVKVNNNYTVNWMNGNGSVFDSANVNAGTTTYEPNPTKDASEFVGADEANFFYTLTGWTYSGMVGTVKTYQPQFTTERKYTVIWLKEDDSPLDTQYYRSSEIEPVTAAVPVKDRTDTVVYQFSGWSLESQSDYVKTYSPTFREYTRPTIWFDGNGKLLAYNKSGGTQPSSADKTDENYTYTFAGTWTSSEIADTDILAYTADFNWTERNTLTVRWMQSETGDDVLYSVTYKDGLTEPGLPDGTVCPAKVDGTNYYTFSNWDSGSTEQNVKTYRPVFNTAVDTSTGHWEIWLNGDGSELSRHCIEGDSQTFSTPPDGTPNPTKTGRGYTYTFNGWSSDSTVENVTTYTPQFTKTYNLKVTWTDWDSNSALTTYDYKDGETPPTEPPTGVVPQPYDSGIKRRYFTGWTKVSGESTEIVYNPVYQEVERSAVTTP